MAKHPHTYALYYGDKFVDVGTINDIAKRQHRKARSLRFLGTKHYKQRKEHPEQGWILIKLEDNCE